MSCCESQNKKCSRPKEEMLSAETVISLLDEGSWVLKKLLDIAQGGARFVGFKSASVNELAAIIASVIAENNYLKSLLGVFNSDKPDTTTASATISFGPRNEYKLLIPAMTAADRAKIIAALVASGQDLTAQKQSAQQQYLPFSS